MPYKILVVDDEPDIVQEWETALSIENHDVATALNASTAIKQCKENPFDLVILDYLMPDMTGIELLNEIRNHLPHIKSIIISGKLDDNYNEDDLMADISGSIETDAYLRKPVTDKEFVETIDRVMAKEPSEDWVKVAEQRVSAVTTDENVKAAEEKLDNKRK